jgi:hypothetical protein
MVSSIVIVDQLLGYMSFASGLKCIPVRSCKVFILPLTWQELQTRWPSLTNPCYDANAHYLVILASLGYFCFRQVAPRHPRAFALATEFNRTLVSKQCRQPTVAQVVNAPFKTGLPLWLGQGMARRPLYVAVSKFVLTGVSDILGPPRLSSSARYHRNGLRSFQ